MWMLFNNRKSNSYCFFNAEGVTVGQKSCMFKSFQELKKIDNLVLNYLKHTKLVL